MKYLFSIGWFLIWSLWPGNSFGEVDKKNRPFYEYKGDYRGSLNKQKDRFRNAYGYELIDLDSAWRPDEIELMDKAFSQLPPSFYRIPELKGIYRVSQISSTREGLPPEEVPAATFPAYSTIFRHQSQSHNIYLDKDFFRVEFYNPLFHENERQLINIIHHEMGHALDLSRGMISVSNSWLVISQFKILNLPALDQRRGVDFLFTFINRSEVDLYAPVSTRQQATYSRLSPQEDFANSVAAYIHYPHFAKTHPKRYQYLKKIIFQGQEYFGKGGGSKNYEEWAINEFKGAFEKSNWRQVEQVVREISRSHFPKAKAGVAKFLLERSHDIPSKVAHSIVSASCFLMHPDSVKFRRYLVRQKKIRVKDVLKIKRCLIVGRDSFEKFLTKEPITNLYFFQNDGKDYIQFLDPGESFAFTRGFVTYYEWEMRFAEAKNKILAKGQVKISSGGNGSFRFNLQESATNPYEIPTGSKLSLKVVARRSHPRNFKIYHSNPKEIKFVIHPWFDYFPIPTPKVKAIYPINLLSLNKDTSE